MHCAFLLTNGSLGHLDSDCYWLPATCQCSVFLKECVLSQQSSLRVADCFDSQGMNLDWDLTYIIDGEHIVELFEFNGTEVSLIAQE